MRKAALALFAIVAITLSAAAQTNLGPIKISGGATINNSDDVAQKNAPNAWQFAQTFKFEPWFDVTVWGAKCDNATDDAAAFTAAINAAKVLGGTVYIPQGAICRSSAIANFQSTQGVTFQGGIGGGQALNGNMARFIYTGSTAPAVAFGSSYGFQMKGIMVQYSNASFTGNVVDGLPPGCPGSCAGDTSHAFIAGVIIDSLASINTANACLSLERTNTSHFQHTQFGHCKYDVQGFTAANNYSNGNVLGPGLEFTGSTTRTAMIENPGTATQIVAPNFELTAGTNPVIAVDCSLASSGLGMTVDAPDFEDDNISVAHNLTTCGNTVKFSGGRWSGNVNATAIKLPASGYVSVFGGVLQTLGTFIDATAGNARVFVDGTQQDTSTVGTMLAGTPIGGIFCQFQGPTCDYYGPESKNGLVTFKNVNTIFKSPADSEQDIDHIAGTAAEQQKCDRYYKKDGATLLYRVCVDNSTNPIFKVFDGDGNARLQFSYVPGSNAGTILSCQGTCGLTLTASGINVVWNGTTFAIAGGVTGTSFTATAGVSGATYSTATNCASAGGTCGSAAAGRVTIAAAASTVTVASTAVTANSEIFIQEQPTSAMAAALSVSCNGTTGRTYTVTTQTAGTSFVITASAAPATNPACLSYRIVN